MRVQLYIILSAVSSALTLLLLTDVTYSMRVIGNQTTSNVNSILTSTYVPTNSSKQRTKLDRDKTHEGSILSRRKILSMLALNRTFQLLV